MLLALCGLAICYLPVTGWASDLTREHRIAAELSDSVIEGDSVFLTLDGQAFWNIYTTPAGTPKGAVIILHGRGLHPDWPAVVRPLRTGLPRHDWATFSMQMPVLPKGSEFEDYAVILPEAAPRIEAGIRHLRGLGYQQVHLVAHSCGAQMTMAWLDAGGGAGIDSLTLISLGMSNYERRFGHLPPLDRVAVPILDLYGGADFVAARATERRQILRRAGSPFSRQVAIPGARHMFKQQGAQLIDTVAAWLASLPGV